MAYEPSLFSFTGVPCRVFNSAGHRTIASYERELAEHRGTETRLRGALAREEALLRKKDELIQPSRDTEPGSRPSPDERPADGREPALAAKPRRRPMPDAAAHLSSPPTGRPRSPASTAACIPSMARKPCPSSRSSTSCARNIPRCWPRKAATEASSSRAVEARLPGATAIPLSLIANELITNAAKHGRGAITVRLEALPQGGHVLSVCNDGPALPQGFDPAAGAGLGMKIVLALVEQIGGKLQIDRCGQCQGMRFAVAFA